MPVQLRDGRSPVDEPPGDGAGAGVAMFDFENRHHLTEVSQLPAAAWKQCTPSVIGQPKLAPGARGTTLTSSNSSWPTSATYRTESSIQNRHGLRRPMAYLNGLGSPSTLISTRATEERVRVLAVPVPVIGPTSVAKAEEKRPVGRELDHPAVVIGRRLVDAEQDTLAPRIGHGRRGECELGDCGVAVVVRVVEVEPRSEGCSAIESKPCSPRLTT